MFFRKLTFCAFLCFIFLSTIGATSLNDEVASLLGKGRKEEAKLLYKNYLKSSIGDPSYAQHLIDASLLEKTSTLSIAMIKSYASKISTPDGREFIYTELGAMYELLGMIDDAAISYKKAFEFSRPANFRLAIHSAFLDLERGETQKALDDVATIYSKNIGDPSLKNYILTIMFIIYAREKAIVTGSRLAEQEIDFINKEANEKLLLALYRFYSHSNQKGRATLSKAMLKNKFPTSLEAMIIDDLVLRYPSPVNLW